MDNKSNKYKFVRKNNSNIKSNKKIRPHYSKIICSIFNQMKEKEIKKKKKEKSITKTQNNNIGRLFILKNNRLKDLFISSNPSTNKYNTIINKNKTKINKNIHKNDNKIFFENMNKKTSIIKNNNSEKKIKKHIIDYNINLTKRQDKEIQNNNDVNIIYLKGNKNNNNNKNQKNKIINNNSRKTFLTSNMHYFHNIKNEKSINLDSSNNHNNDNKIRKLKKIYKSRYLNNSELFLKNKIINKKILYRNKNNNNYINKTPLSNFKHKQFTINLTNNKSNSNSKSKSNSNNISKISKHKNSYLTNIKENNRSQSIFSQENNNNNNAKDKIFVIPLKDKINNLNISNISLNNSCHSSAHESKGRRSLSKKRDEKKMKNIRENELYSENAYKKIIKLYSYIKEKKNNYNEKISTPHIKLIDRIRRDKKLNDYNLYIKTE